MIRLRVIITQIYIISYHYCNVVVLGDNDDHKYNNCSHYYFHYHYYHYYHPHTTGGSGRDRDESMGHLVTNIVDAGLLPGLWLAPFAADQDSRLSRDHPEWILRYSKGE